MIKYKFFSKQFATIIIIVFVIILLVWIVIPTHVLSFNSEKVSEIYILNRNNGYEVTINDKSEIQYIISNLSQIEFKKKKLALGFGVHYHFYIYGKDKKIISDFIIQTDKEIIKGPFIYQAISAVIDISYIDKIFQTRSIIKQ